MWFSLINEKHSRMTSGVKIFPLCTHIQSGSIEKRFSNENLALQGSEKIHTWKIRDSQRITIDLQSIFCESEIADEELQVQRDSSTSNNNKQ